MKKIIILSIALALFSCKKESTPAPSNPPLHSSSSSSSLIGSWAVDSMYWHNTMYRGIAVSDTLIFTATTMNEWEDKSVNQNYSIKSDSLILTISGDPNKRDWQYNLSSNNLILKCDTESQYLHKY